MKSITFELSDKRKAALNEQLSSIGCNPYNDFNKFQTSIKKLLINVFGYFNDCLDSFLETLSHPGVLVLKNLPIDEELPDTPLTVNYPIAEKNTFISEGILTLIGHRLGTIFSFKEEHDGAIIRSISPNINKLSAVTGGIYGAHELKLHTEVAWASHRPDFVVLLCLRQNPSTPVKTIVSFSQDAFNVLSADDKDNLRSPSFHIALPELFRGDIPPDKLWTEAGSVISGPDELISVRANFNFMRCFNLRISKSLNTFEQSSLSCSEELLLEPGDMLIMDNRKVIHGRNSFSPMFNGKDRWLQQIYVYTDPWKVREKCIGQNILSL